MLLLTALALAAPAPTADEAAKLALGEVVIRAVSASTDAAIAVVGFVDVPATRDAVWTILLDFPGRRPTNPSITRIEEYLPRTAVDQWWLFTIQKFGTTVTYHNHYTVDASGGVLDHALDPTRTNDLAKNTGTYTLGACASSAPPCTRLTWEVETDFGRSIPGFVKNWLGRAAVEGFLADLATRAAKR
ncbi:MAG: SRPBCC family protein [Deltaproteobacteria bacterium]|nr:SRPBCC family protein [Deltaproteobacteria bacterium]